MDELRRRLEAAKRRGGGGLGDNAKQEPPSKGPEQEGGAS